MKVVYKSRVRRIDSFFSYTWRQFSKTHQPHKIYIVDEKDNAVRMITLRDPATNKLCISKEGTPYRFRREYFEAIASELNPNTRVI